MLLWACGTAFSLLYLVENRTWLVMFLRKLYRPLSFQAKFRLGSLKLSLSAFLNDFHSGLLSKGPLESADGDHDHHLRHRHHHNIHHYHWLWSSGGTVSHPMVQPLATGRPTSNSHGRGRSRTQPGGRAAGNPHHREPQWGRGPWGGGGGGEGGPSSAARRRQSPW